jgi:hypothetical protein
MSLQIITPHIMNIPPEEVRSPDFPVPTALQEAQDLLHFVRASRVHAALVRVGQAPDFVADLEQRLAAAREAQSEWVTVRDSTKPTELVELEARAASLRSDVVAAARFNLRNDRLAQTTLSSITNGDGVADLIQDLFDLAALVEKHTVSFEADQSFDAEASVAQARGLAQALSSRVSSERTDSESLASRVLRDRAFTYLDDFVSEVRSAGRYAFRNEPSVLTRFTSEYLRRRRRRTQRARKAAEHEVPASPVGTGGSEVESE